MSVNLIDILVIKYKEDIISNLLIGLINNLDKFAKKFTNNILNIKEKIINIEAIPRIRTSVGIPDIIIKLRTEVKDYLIILENKLK